MRSRISGGMTTGWAKTTNCILLPMISMVSILPCLLLLLALHLPNLLLHKNMFSKYFTLVALCGLSYHLINLPTSLARCLIPDHSSLSHHICTSALHFISFSARLGLLFMTIVRLVSLNKRNFNTKREKLVFMLVVPIILVIGLVCSGVATYLEVAHGKGWGVFEVAQFSIVDVLVSLLIICASLANLRRLQKSQKTESVQNINRWVQRLWATFTFKCWELSLASVLLVICCGGWVASVQLTLISAHYM